jgi:hypothetical protein
MRIILAAALAGAIATPAFAADPVAPEAQPAIDGVTAVMQNSKNARFRKLKVSAAGDVCGTVSASAASRDLEFIWTKATGAIWLNESPQEAYSAFVYGAPHLKRSTERSDFQAWKACQKG